MVRAPASGGWGLWALTHALAELARVRFGLRLWPPRFLCLNDDLGPSPDPAFVAGMRAELERLFPRPSRFEK